MLSSPSPRRAGVTHGSAAFFGLGSHRVMVMALRPLASMSRISAAEYSILSSPIASKVRLWVEGAADSPPTSGPQTARAQATLAASPSNFLESACQKSGSRLPAVFRPAVASVREVSAGGRYPLAHNFHAFQKRPCVRVECRLGLGAFEPRE